jgi:hypothetical protein
MGLAAKALPSREFRLEDEELETIRREIVAAEQLLVTEDGQPVDSVFAEKQMRLLTEPLHSSWNGPPPEEDGGPRPFVAMANVGLFWVPQNPAVVPDVLVSVDVMGIFGDGRAKQERSYFLWRYGKPPDIVLEIVSDKRGDELGDKRRKYERMRIPYYVVYDPQGVLGADVVRTFRFDGSYEPMPRPMFEKLGLGLVLWEGWFEGWHHTWLRWCDLRGVVIPTGAERADEEKQHAEAEKRRAETEQRRAEAEQRRAEAEKQRAEAEKQRAETEKQRAETEKQRADAAEERLAALMAKLRAKGIEPNGT